ncbi:hypothetical protein ONE63_008502 [Megalurothrips usitatus]|uniref:beta-N-acetylhexosaminidase n=1 Tax=Megalurothrips usitatus TaxID=439358 RepID=A0AAV7XQJ5_9NEOP|nr:hypothetical protein ONE63_008502 [Megalurothrips usitatus]
MDDLISRSHRLVHLDLKGAPPKLSYLEKLIPLFKEWGATGLLVEWEDTFPYHGNLAIVGSRKEAGRPYSEDEIKRILFIAKECGLNTIPLVQTFGHLEFLLKHEEWKCLREVPQYPSSICPSHPNTQDVIWEMVKQVIDFHSDNSDLEYVHIGADEVWHLGLCEVCSQRCGNAAEGRGEIFVDHVLSIAKRIKEAYSKVKLIIWDDMLRSIPTDVLKNFNLGLYVEPMVWLYFSAENFQIPEGLWEKYSSTFSSVWVASAFKGATGSCQQLPSLPHHVSNHERWLKELPLIVSKFDNFRGIALTGWSRYDHYATLCEMLPVSLPSLALCLSVWINNGFSIEVLHNVARALGFSDPILMGMDFIPRPKPIPTQLSFPGWKALASIELFCNLEHTSRIHLDSSQIKTWLNAWQIKNSFANPMHIETFIPPLAHLLVELGNAERFLRESLEPIIYPAAIEEWVASWIDPLREQVQKLVDDARAQLKTTQGPSGNGVVDKQLL